MWQNLTGAVIGCLAGGPLSDYVVAKISKRRRGYFEPEFRLWCLIPPFILGPVGLMLWGCGLGNHLSSTVPIVGDGITYGVLATVPIIGITYVVDCYRSQAGETMTILTALKNTIAFGLSFAVIPWLNKDGYVEVSSLLPRCFSISSADYRHTGSRLANSDRGSDLLHDYTNVYIWEAVALMDWRV